MEKLPGMMKDKMPGQGVQPWSVGDIYPLVIARVERYEPSFAVAVAGKARVNVNDVDAAIRAVMREMFVGPAAIARTKVSLAAGEVVDFDYGFASARITPNPVFESKSWNVLNADDDMSGFASYDDAFAATKGYLAAKAAKPKVYLSSFNPAAYDAELAADAYGVV